MKKVVAVFSLMFMANVALAIVTIEQTSRTFERSSNVGSITTAGTGSWTATTTEPWITFSRASGDAGTSCIYKIAANRSADTRIGVIFIADAEYIVTQKGCEATVSPTLVNVDVDGGSGEITLLVDSDVAWSATSDSEWLEVYPQSGNGPASVVWAANENGEVASRKASLLVAGKTVSFVQKGAGLRIVPQEVSLDGEASVFTVVINADPATSWQVLPQDSWIYAFDVESGTGSATIYLYADENPNMKSRTGVVKVGNQDVVVRQRGIANPSLSVYPTSKTVSPYGAVETLNVYATPGAAWAATTTDKWISLKQSDGEGNGVVEFVASANPLTTPRTGTVQIPVPFKEPASDLLAGLVLYMKEIYDDATGRRSMSRSCTTRFDGTWFNVVDSGDELPAQEKNDFSFSCRFSVENESTINRLALLFGHSLYVDASNVLSFDDYKCDYIVKRDIINYLVVTQTDGGRLVLYAGNSSEKQMHKVLTVQCEHLHDFGSPTDVDSMDFLVLGYAVKPSAGYLNGGKISHVRFWSRSLNEEESNDVIRELDSFADSECHCVEYKPRAVSETLTSYGYEHFPLCGNLAYYEDENVTPQFVKRCTTGYVYNGDCLVYDAWNFDKGAAFYEMEGWTVAHDRIGLEARGLHSNGEGKILIKDINKVIKGDYILNNGKEFGISWPKNYWKQLNTVWNRSPLVTLPYPATSTLRNSTYNLWIRLDDYPEGKTVLFERKRQNSNGDVAYVDSDYDDVIHMNPIYMNNTNLTVNVTSIGQIEIVQNGTSTTLTGGRINVGEWTMLTMVGTSEQSIAFYINGAEIGNVPTKLWFGYFPPTDGRYRKNTTSGYISSDGEFHYGRPEGWLIPQIQRLIIGGWNGSLDEITFYRKNLSASEVAELYQSQRREIKKIDIVQGVLSPSVSPLSIEVDAHGGEVEVDLTIAQSVTWGAETSESWIQCIDDTGTGSKTIHIRVSPNDTTEYRSGVLTIAGQTVEIKQEGQIAKIEYEGGVMDTDGGYGFIHVDVGAGVSWTAVSDASWLFLEEVEGVGSTSIMVVADPSSSMTSARTATVHIGGRTLYITQRSFPLTLSVDKLSYKVGGGVGEVKVTAQEDADWEMIVTEPWIKVVGSMYGVGSKKIYFTVDENLSGLARNAEIIVSGVALQIYQNGKHTISAKVVGNGSVVGCGQYETSEKVEVSAIAASGFTFSHWSGEADGCNATTTITVDGDKEIVANFIPDQAAQKIAEVKAGEIGLYTRDQIHNLEMGNLIIDVDPSTRDARVGLRLMETSDLAHPNWQTVNVNVNDLDVGSDGSVGVRVHAAENAKFYRMVVPSK